MANALAIILAAGQGTRMNSDLPKVLFPACEKPMIHHVIAALNAAGVQRCVVVVGYREDLVKESLDCFSGVEFAVQSERLGTGHAVMMCRDQIESHEGPVLVVAGDSPMIQTKSIESLLQRFETDNPACILGTLLKDDPTGLGRIVRDSSGAFDSIVEQRDATDEQLSINEVNMSTYVFDAKGLSQALSELKPENQQQEYYLTDCPSILKERGRLVIADPILQPCEALSVNTPEELATVESAMRRMGY